MKIPNRFMQGLIVIALLTYFGVAVFLPALKPGVELDQTLTQTLINLVIAAVSYYIGTNAASAKKDDTIAGLKHPPSVAEPPKE